MRRLTVLDGMRGWFLVTMTISHIILSGHVWVKELHFARTMFVESAQGFIFLAGLLGGIFLTSKLSKSGFEAGLTWAGGRVAKLWLVSVGMILSALYLRQFLPDGAWIFRNWMGLSGTGEAARAWAVGLLVYQPTFMDILPQYILYLAAAPFAVWMILRGQWAVVAALSLVCWFSAQLGLWRPLEQQVNQLFEAYDGQGMRIAFHAAAWQIVFMTGLICGTLWRMGKLDPERFFPRDPQIALALTVILLFFLPLRMATAHGWFPSSILEVFGRMETRRTFGPVYLVSFLSAAWLLAWVLYRGEEIAAPWLNRITHQLRQLLHWAPAVAMGRHSMVIYVWHVALVYGLRYLDGFYGPFEMVPRNLLAISTLLILPLPALMLEARAPLWQSSPSKG